MAVLAVWTFPDVDAARSAEHSLARLSARRAVCIDDGAVLTWRTGAGRPRRRDLHSIALDDAVGGDFWAVLFAVVFLLPTVPDLDPAGAAATSDVLGGLGIGRSFTGDLRRVTGPGTSALAVLIGDGILDGADAALSPLRPTLTCAALDGDRLRTLRRVFAG